MNPLYKILTASEAAALWDLEGSTVRRAAWEGRIKYRKSAGTLLVTMADMRERYGPMPEHNACDFIVDHLTPDDVHQWHEESNATENVKALMAAVGLDCIQIWGSHDGPEPLGVNLC